MGRKRMEGNTTEATESNGDVVMSKADKFRELGNKRLAKAEQALRSLAYLANTNQYEYSQEQKDRVLELVEEWTARVKAAFAAGKPLSSGARNYV